MTPAVGESPGGERGFLPVGLDLTGMPCVVVGGGEVGTRKALLLRRTGARVVVVSPRITPTLEEMVDGRKMVWIPEPFAPAHLWGAFLVVVATDDPEVNAAAAEAARKDGALLCDATSAERSRVIFGATLNHRGVTVAVFTGGRDPAHARRTRDRIASLLEVKDRPPSPTISGEGRC